MRSHPALSIGGALVLLLAIAGAGAHAIQAREENDLVSLLVWDADRPIDLSAVAPDVRDQVTRLQQRARDYKSP